MNLNSTGAEIVDKAKESVKEDERRRQCKKKPKTKKDFDGDFGAPDNKRLRHPDRNQVYAVRYFLRATEKGIKFRADFFETVGFESCSKRAGELEDVPCFNATDKSLKSKVFGSGPQPFDKNDPVTEVGKTRILHVTEQKNYKEFLKNYGRIEKLGKEAYVLTEDMDGSLLLPVLFSTLLSMENCFVLESSI
ncbi:unnamed protein product [Caenorhabditis brenneri]